MRIEATSESGSLLSGAGVVARRHNGDVGKTFQQIDGPLAEWLVAQPVFFISTAPLSHEGYSTVRRRAIEGVRGTRTSSVAYLDQTGSGIETIAHLRENGRIVSCSAPSADLHGLSDSTE